jgi:hypothetical protein
VLDEARGLGLVAGASKKSSWLNPFPTRLDDASRASCSNLDLRSFTACSDPKLISCRCSIEPARSMLRSVQRRAEILAHSPASTAPSITSLTPDNKLVVVSRFRKP